MPILNALKLRLCSQTWLCNSEIKCTLNRRSNKHMNLLEDFYNREVFGSFFFFDTLICSRIKRRTCLHEHLNMANGYGFHFFLQLDDGIASYASINEV